MKRSLQCLTACFLLGAAPVAHAADSKAAAAAEQVTKLTRGTTWKQVEAIPINFLTHHPQGMVKIGEHFFVSSVEIKTPTKRFPEPVDGYDRDTGEGVGHLFKIDRRATRRRHSRSARARSTIRAGSTTTASYIWVPVAEYRPNSRSIIYRVDPKTMTATEVFRFGDHIGGHRPQHRRQDPARRQLGLAAVLPMDARRATARSPTPMRAGEAADPQHAHYIDYQDCKYAGQRPHAVHRA